MTTSGKDLPNFVGLNGKRCGSTCAEGSLEIFVTYFARQRVVLLVATERLTGGVTRCGSNSLYLRRHIIIGLNCYSATGYVSISTLCISTVTEFNRKPKRGGPPHDLDCSTHIGSACFLVERVQTFVFRQSNNLVVLTCAYVFVADNVHNTSSTNLPQRADLMLFLLTKQWFWETVRSFDEEQQGQFLKFVTSCSRPPLLGFERLNPPICVQRVPDGEEGRLPSSATCMNLLKVEKIWIDHLFTALYHVTERSLLLLPRTQSCRRVV